MSDTGSPTEDATVDPTPDEERALTYDGEEGSGAGHRTADHEADEADAQEQARGVPLDDDDR